MAKRGGNTNSLFHSAKKAKNDEFYTQLPDIENELCHYTNQLKGKTIFCNCDDPAESNFFFYFVSKFKALKLKKLITTHYQAEGKSYKIEVGNADMAKKITDIIKQGYDFNSDMNRNILQSFDVITPLQKNGDFRSTECIELLKQSDVVITNPPFSLFREYVSQIVEYGKKFLIIGNTNAIAYKEIFKLIKENKLQTGYTNFNVGMYFMVPDYYDTYKEMRNGKKYVRVSTSCWFTNLEVAKHNAELTLYKHYTPKEYPKYDNYDAIEVSRVAEIPMDYDGVMGVPITFLDKHNPKQFDILGMSASAGYNEEIVGIPFLGNKDARPLNNGKNKYARIFIKKRGIKK